ncbi:hypothetical protein OM076_09055 [Solirubrobacter ginsenosidimutans]|uniref:Uncharacterized protein n=1 Tax=Solirubrobacter ginsenosidimutans TaxID=490573 RepID=A0A9X3S0T6_9ACTN|nr:hypothetical protein [Solirubrobacter ginsenosidimutans]MDA0160412.1 hypothetical protein [Solirubrobacter ginsenosidimutans]
MGTDAPTEEVRVDAPAEPEPERAEEPSGVLETLERDARLAPTAPGVP